MLLCLISSMVSANPSLSTFGVVSNFLQNGKIKVYNNGTTEFFAIIGGSRSNVSGGGFEAVDMEVVFYMVENIQENILKTINIKTSDFDGAFLRTYNESGNPLENNWVKIAIPQAIERGTVRLKYRFKDATGNWMPGGNGYYAFNNSSYETINVGSPYMNESHLAKIQSMGFSTNGIQSFNNDYYLVDGDVLIKKDGLNNANYNSYLINGNNDHNVNILIDNSIWSNNTWYAALQEALKVWNSVPNSNIKINLISSPDGYYGATPRTDIILKGDNGVLPASVATYAAYPKGDGNPGDLIVVNSDFNQNSQQSTWNMIHAIGHALGLKHAVNNSSSVMNKGNFLTSYPSNLNFALPTSYDINSITSLYPLNLNSTILPYIHGRNGTFSLSYYSVESGINYSWKIEGTNGTNYTYEESGAAIVSELYLSPGNYRVQCIISNGKYSIPVTVSKNIIL